MESIITYIPQGDYVRKKRSLKLNYIKWIKFKCRLKTAYKYCKSHIKTNKDCTCG